MKRFLTLFTLLLSAVTLSSCDALEDLNIVGVDTTVSEGFVFDIPAGQTTFSNNFTITIEDETVKENMARIEEIVINSLTYEIVDVSGTSNVIAGGSFSANSTNLPLFASAGNSVNLTLSDAEDTVYDITLEAALLTALANDLKSGGSATLSVAGTVSESPVKFTILVDLDVTIKVAVL